MLPAAPSFLAPLLARPVAVLGAGVSGQGVLGLLQAVGARGVLYDGRAEGAERDFTAAAAAQHGLVVFSPGFAPEHRWLAHAHTAGCTCLGELDFAALFWPGETIAITGTNGKTTLTEFLAHALNTAGLRAAVTGNVGYPFSRFVVEQAERVGIAVCEVSSFQAETLQHFAPEAVLWTNFAEDHLERHAGLPAYFAAKWRLVERVRGAVFLGSSVQRGAEAFGCGLPAGAAVASERQPPDERLTGTVFAGYPQYENFLLAAAWWRRRGLHENDLVAAARSFRLGDHRLGRVAEIRGVTWWNDSKATNFHAVEAALATFDRPVHLLLGGKAKGGDLGAFVGRIAARVRHAYLLGETQAELAQHCRAHGVPHTACATLAPAVSAAAAAAQPGDAVLLSPGFASFDLFASYADRGRQFAELVRKLSGEPFLDSKSPTLPPILPP